MTIPEFIAKWRKVELKERSAAQEHFIDLCALIEHPTPAAADPTGAAFCFEKGAAKHGGGDGFADVWKRGFFGWEYKGRHKNLDAAYDQLLRYRDALENPPLLVLCDLDRIIIRTNFTGTVSVAHEIPLEALGQPRNIEILRAVFHDPERLRPGRTSTAVTQDAARCFADIAASMRQRGHDPAAVAHFLDRIVFCLFAEDTALLPDKVFSRILSKSANDPQRFTRFLGQLFQAMATGGDFGLETIRHFNGSLFDDPAVLHLSPDDIPRIADAAALDWSAVDPSIFGTLFERGLDPAKRSQLGAHFTSREDIECIVDAVVMPPLRREWDETRTLLQRLLATGKKTPAAKPPARPLSAAAQRKARAESASILHRFLIALQNVKILDPACGSGNFLYVALLRLKDLEKEAILFGNDNGLGAFLPLVGPWQLHGIEINPYAHDLAQMTVWIGWLQWIRLNGFGFPSDPILRPLSNNIRLMDAILANPEFPHTHTPTHPHTLTPPAPDPASPEPAEPEWPKVDFIIGNPPFLGGKMLRRELGDAYVDRMLAQWKGRVPAEADLCCYWFEKARAQIAAGQCKRAGLLATQGIRGGANRQILKRIKETGDIFWAQSDRPWILDGANVHVSMVAFDDGEEQTRLLDGNPIATISQNLTSGPLDITNAAKLSSNEGKAFMGITPAGPFDLSDEVARPMLLFPNPHGRPNSDVLRPYFNGKDLNQRSRCQWTVDFGVGRVESDAVLYEQPYAHVSENVKPVRMQNNREAYRHKWWLFAEAREGMRSAFEGLDRYLATCMVAKYRLFVWLPPESLPANVVIVFARSDDLFFGILHSRFHEVWALKLGTRLETRPRYTPTTCFETFPFPPGVIPEPSAPAARTGDTCVAPSLPPDTPLAAIAAAAKELNQLRENWLNPPEWTRTETLEFPGTVGGPWHRYIDPATIEDRGAFQIGTVRYPRIIPRDPACAARLKDRTLTKLYNARPAWLQTAHTKLDTAVAAAYNLPPDLPEEPLLQHLLTLNQSPE